MDKQLSMGWDDPEETEDASSTDTDDLLMALDGGTPIFWMFSREDIEAGNVASVLSGLKGLMEPPLIHALRQSINFGVEGYDNDTRELFQIFEVRRFLKALDDQWPYWFYFADPEQPSSFQMLTFCLCKPVLVDGGAQLESSELGAFLERHFLALNTICEILNDPDDVVEAMSNRILAIYEMGEASQSDFPQPQQPAPSPVLPTPDVEGLETVLNLWYLIDENGYIPARLARAYRLSGTEKEKFATLRHLAKCDWKLAEFFPCPDHWITVDTQGNHQQGITSRATVDSMGSNGFLFEDVFRSLDALWEKEEREVRVGDSPLHVITPLIITASGEIVPKTNLTPES